MKSLNSDYIYIDNIYIHTYIYISKISLNKYLCYLFAGSQTCLRTVLVYTKIVILLYKKLHCY